MNTRQVISVAVLIVLLIIGVFIYFLFFTGKPAAVPVAPIVPANNLSFPFGTGTTTPSSNNNQNTAAPTTATPSYPNGVFLVSTNGQNAIPSTGGVSLDKSASTTIMRYAERGTGHIYEISNQYAAKEIIDTTIPRIYESIWLPDENSVIMRYLNEGSDTITTFYGKLTGISGTSTGPGKLDGVFLPDDIKDLSVGPGGKIFSLFATGGRGMGVISAPDGTNPDTIFNSPLTEWLSQWPRTDVIALTTKASYAAPGYLYFLNANTGALTKILGGIDGLATLTNSAASEVFYSAFTNGGLSSNVYNIKTAAASPFPFATLAEKCAWSKTTAGLIYCAVPHGLPAGNYPDDWYQGKITTTDDIWSVDTVTGKTTLLVDSTASNFQFDGIKLFLDPKENYLYFTDKRSGILWTYRLK